MLIEGVPPAMIENIARMAGMPVGPLSRSTTRWRSISGSRSCKATKTDLGTNAIDPAQKKLVVEHGREARAASAARTARDFTIIPRGARTEQPVAGLAELRRNTLDPDTLDVRS